MTQIEASNVPGGQYRFSIVSSPSLTRFWNVSQISQWKLEDIASQVIQSWKDGSSISDPNWTTDKKKEILRNLVQLRENTSGDTWIGVPTEVKMGFQLTRVILPFFWKS